VVFTDGVTIFSTSGFFHESVIPLFATVQQHLRNWWQNLLPVANLPVPLIPVVHLVCEYPNGILWGWGETE
jgi:hypothetical protein